MNDTAEVPALHGWRRELFGEAALALKHGRLALAVEKGRVVGSTGAAQLSVYTVIAVAASIRPPLSTTPEKLPVGLSPPTGG